MFILCFAQIFYYLKKTLEDAAAAAQLSSVLCLQNVCN